MKLELYLREPCLGSPFAPMQKCNPVVGAAAISGLSSLIGNLFGSANQSDANKTNYQIAQMNSDLQRETNQQNYQMFQEQNAFNKNMWEENNQYNLPKNVVNRLLDAGINPAAVFGSGSVTPASQIQSGLPTPMQAPSLDYKKQAYFPDLSGVATAASGYFQNKLMSAQANNVQKDSESKDIQNTFDKLANPVRLKQLKSLASRDDYLGQMAKLELNYTQAIQGQRISQAFNDTRLQYKMLRQYDVDIAGRELQNALVNVQLSYAPALNEAQLKQYYEAVNQIRSVVALNLANASLTREQKISEIERRVGIIADSELKKINKEVADKVKQYTIDKAELEVDDAYWSVEDKAKTVQLGRELDRWPSANFDGSYTEFNRRYSSRHKERRYKKGYNLDELMW